MQLTKASAADCDNSTNYIVGTVRIDEEGKEVFSISKTPRLHTSFTSARLECERLAGLEIGVRFVPLLLGDAVVKEAEKRFVWR